MPDKIPGETHKAYMERCVPKLIKEGKNPDQAVKICSEMFSKAEEMSELEVELERSVEFAAEVNDAGFRIVMQEDTLVSESMSFVDVFKALGCESGKRYEISIEVEEC